MVVSHPSRYHGRRETDREGRRPAVSPKYKAKLPSRGEKRSRPYSPSPSPPSKRLKQITPVVDKEKTKTELRSTESPDQTRDAAQVIYSSKPSKEFYHLVEVSVDGEDSRRQVLQATEALTELHQLFEDKVFRLQNVPHRGYTLLPRERYQQTGGEEDAREREELEGESVVNVHLCGNVPSRVSASIRSASYGLSSWQPSAISLTFPPLWLHTSLKRIVVMDGQQLILLTHPK